MKVGPFEAILRVTQGLKSARVQSKSDSAQSGGRNSQGQKQPGQDSHDPRDERNTASEQEVAAAIESFAQDKDAQKSGIRAEVEGAGPGLKVFLKDSSGSVLRQLSGLEFVQMREAAASDSRVRGKLLDQKL